MPRPFSAKPKAPCQHEPVSAQSVGRKLRKTDSLHLQTETGVQSNPDPSRVKYELHPKIFPALSTRLDFRPISIENCREIPPGRPDLRRFLRLRHQSQRQAARA